MKTIAKTVALIIFMVWVLNQPIVPMSVQILEADPRLVYLLIGAMLCLFFLMDCEFHDINTLFIGVIKK